MPTETVILGGGCFWCTEAVFKSLKGVVKTTPGYAGGEKLNPNYEEVCSGTTGHAEVTRVEFDPSRISFSDLLTVFFASHDPTTLNQQGNDIGTQYRSIILYTNNNQRIEAEQFIKKLDQGKDSGPKTVTEVKSLDRFYVAEDYHQNYFANNQNQPYCALVISPKLKKLKEKFSSLLANSN